MLHIWMEQNVLFYGMIGAGILGILCMFMVDRFYGRAIRDVRRITEPKGKWTKEFLNQYQMRLTKEQEINNPEAFVRTQLARGKTLGIGIQKWKQGIGYSAVLCFLLILTAVYGTYRYEQAQLLRYEYVLTGAGIFALLLLMKQFMGFMNKEDMILQFLLLSDRSSQGSVTALLRRYAEDIRTPDQLFEPDDGPVAAHLHLYPAAAFGEKFLYPPAAPRTAAPLAPVQAETLDPDQLRKEQQLLLDYARLAVTEENVALLAQQALAARPQVEASTLAEEYPGDFARIIGLHTYSQSPHRNYDIRLTGNWVERGGFRFEDFVLTRRKEENDGND